MNLRALLALGGLAILAAAPLVLRPAPPAAAKHDSLVIISPHDLQTRVEFSAAFARYAAEHLGISVDVDWRTPGGTNEITRYLAAQYRQSFRIHHPQQAPAAGLEGFQSDATDKPTASSGAKAARAAFLAEDSPDAVSSGIDLWWGGGEYPHKTAARNGLLVDAGLLQAEPGGFRPECIPQTLSGETIYDAKGRYYGASLSVFGICSSRDRIAAIPELTTPSAWQDLADPRLFGTLGIVDPSGSAAAESAFERMIQSCMVRQVAAIPGTPTPASIQAAVARGWHDGFSLIKCIGGNSRDVSDGASIAVREVEHGDAAAAMCIDFQARYEADYGEQQAGVRRMDFRAPIGGTSVSADPISLLRGAPHRALAVAFMHFVLSPEGQKLWCYRIGVPGGPRQYTLKRMPVRHDLYGGENTSLVTDPDLDPFVLAARFTYHGAWTGPDFNLIVRLIHATVIDARPELVEAWWAIAHAGGPQQVPEAYAAFTRLPVEYGEAPKVLAVLNGTDTHAVDPLEVLALTRSWVVESQAAYREARTLALEGR